MSCRTNQSGSAHTTVARLGSGLSDRQILSIYHSLRAEAPENAPVPTAAQWKAHLAGTRKSVLTDPFLSDARRANLLGRLKNARSEPPPAANTFYAQQTIAKRALGVRAALDAEYATFANTLGVSMEEVQARAHEYAEKATMQNKARRNPSGRDDLIRAKLKSCGLPQDRGTVAAIIQLKEEAHAANKARESARPSRITRQPPRPGSIAEREGIAEIGYDPSDGRLEIVDGRTGELHAYQNVSENTAGRVAKAGRDHWESRIRGVSFYQYPTAQEAENAGKAPNCGACGQFAFAGHGCPPGTESTRQPRRVQFTPANRGKLDKATTTRVDFPRVTEIRNEARVGPVVFPVNAYTFTGAYEKSSETTTELVVQRDPEGAFRVNSRNPRCSCHRFREEGHCPHVARLVTLAEKWLDPKAQNRTGLTLLTPEQTERAQIAAAEALERDWTRSKAAAQAARARFEKGTGPVYSDDYDAFRAAYDAALDRRDAGLPAVPLLTGAPGEVTGGLGSRDGGRAFGVEIEFEFPKKTNSEAALIAIGRDLADAGLTSTPEQQEYHQSSGDYSSSHAGGWKFEKDVTVAGEIVSPIMYDEPETWTNIEKVCEIVRRHGGTATAKAGSHVHVGTKEYDHEVGNHTELIRTVNAYEDVLFRISQNPAAKSHRPLKYCNPNDTVPAEGYRFLFDERVVDGKPWVPGAIARHHRGSKYSSVKSPALNLQSMYGKDKDHAELRHWDATLDPAVIQAQIKTSLAIVDAAQRNAGRQAPALPRESVGSHAARAAVQPGAGAPVRRSRKAPPRPDDEYLREDSATFRHFADTLFSRRQDKEQLAALFAVTNWSQAA